MALAPHCVVSDLGFPNHWRASPAGTRKLRALGVARAWREALEEIQALGENALEANVIHRNALLSAFQKSQQWSWALQELSTRQLEQEVPTDVVSFSTAAASCPGWLKPLFFLDWMAIGTCRPNVVSISSALAACREGASWPLALDLLRSMHPVHGVLPNVVSMSSILKACALASRWHEALEIFVEASAALVPNIVARNAAQSACAGVGLWALSLSGFQASRGRDLVSINTAMDACDKARRWEWAVEALQQAAVASLVPDVAPQLWIQPLNSLICMPMATLRTAPVARPLTAVQAALHSSAWMAWHPSTSSQPISISLLSVRCP
eukprot:s3925_g3.t1